MKTNKFQKLKIDKDKNYRISFNADVGVDVTLYEKGKDIVITKTHLLCKTFMKKKIHHRNIMKIEEV